MAKATKKKLGNAKKPLTVKKPRTAMAKKKAVSKTVLVKKALAKKPAAKKIVAKKRSGKKIIAKKLPTGKKIVKKPVEKKKAVKAPSLRNATPQAKKKPKKGEATLSIELALVSDDEIDAAIESVVDDELSGDNVFGDEIHFADDDADLDDEAPSASTVASTEGGFPEQMRDAALKVLDERQAEDIVSIPLAGRSSLADYVIIASGRAARQVTALADYLRETFTKLGVKHVRIEGLGESNWVLVDAGDVIVHLFRPEVRNYYDVDSIWAAKHPK